MIAYVVLVRIYLYEIDYKIFVHAIQRINKEQLTVRLFALMEKISWCLSLLFVMQGYCT